MYSASAILLNNNFSILSPYWTLPRQIILDVVLRETISQISLNCTRTVLEWSHMWSGEKQSRKYCEIVL